MPRDDRDLLEVLKFELDFLEKGGYGRSPRAPWRPQFIFEDSPTCMNYDRKENLGPCSDCVLMQLVPPEHRSERIPCRHIPLDPSGETLRSLYGHGDKYEIEEAVANWLRETIKRLDDERKALHRDDNKQATAPGEPMKGTSLYLSLHPKCANPACPTAFHWLGGGKFLFFRFRSDQVSASTSNSTTDSPTGLHDVKHYWLCERCSHVFTLADEAGHGVVLKLLWPELPAAEAHKELTL